MTDTTFELDKGTIREALALPEADIRHLLPSREIVSLCALLILLQILDGLLTGLGMHFLGVHFEANPLLRSLMLQYGYVEALLFSKGLAICIILVLCGLSHAVHWLKYALQIMVGIYLTVAIIPWAYILCQRLLIGA